jgi:hypothetical protein
MCEELTCEKYLYGFGTVPYGSDSARRLTV